MTRLPEHLHYLWGHELATSEQIVEIDAAMKGFAAKRLVTKSYLLHGDLNSRNLFVDHTGFITHLIDWEDALGGDPIFDLAFWATFHPELDHKHLIQAYYHQVVKPADFDYRFWVYYLRIAVSKAVLLHKEGHKDLTRAKGRIETALERLKSIKT